VADLSLTPNAGSAFEIYADHYYTDTVEVGTFEVLGDEYSARVAVHEAGANLYVQGIGCVNEGFVINPVIDAGFAYFDADEDAQVIQGYRFDSYGTVTNPYVRDGSGRPYTRDTIIEEVTYNVQDTGYIEFTVGHAAGNPYTEVFNGMILNHHEFLIGVASELTQDVRVPVKDYRRLVSLSFHSNHHLGFSLMSMEWLARMIVKGRRSS
jgi:hypothetical protein